jgi:predicted DCC family thiol-disulfide oxidoreductase YuxK
VRGEGHNGDVDGTLIYDGDCGICKGSAAWVRHHLRPGLDVSVVKSQRIDDLGAYGLTADDVAAAAWWIDRDGRRHGGHRAVARSLQHCRGAWPVLGRLLTLWPISGAAAALYRWVSANRSRLSRSDQACGVTDQPVR